MSDTKTQNEQENIELESMVHDFLENQVEQKFVALMENTFQSVMIMNIV